MEQQSKNSWEIIIAHTFPAALPCENGGKISTIEETALFLCVDNIAGEIV